MAVACLQMSATAQEKIIPEQANIMIGKLAVAITEAVSFAFTNGASYETFKRNLCGSAMPTETGDRILRTAYDNLSKKLSKAEMIKANEVSAIAAGIKLMIEQKSKPELFGSEKILQQNVVERYTKCRWYQLWCHLAVLFGIMDQIELAAYGPYISP